MSDFVSSDELEGYCGGRLLCPQCHSILVNAVQTRSSGELLCEKCFKEILRLPKNEQIISIKNGNDYFPDRAIRKEIRDLIGQCKKCLWKGTKRNFENHECEVAQVCVGSESMNMDEVRRIYQHAIDEGKQQQDLLQMVGDQQAQRSSHLSQIREVVSPLPQNPAQDIILSSLASVDQQRPPPINGILIWKIPFPAGSDFAISSPFFTAQNGYKMCLYAKYIPNNERFHMSAFFVILRGEYDSLLKWPFSSKVSLVLIDRLKQKHLVQYFRPDPLSNSFAKPDSPMNAPVKFPEFYNVPMSYVQENTLFVKCIVDVSNIHHP